MTTREATRLLTRTTGTDVIGDYGKSMADWAAVITFGALQWPWLLRSLHGGSLADKHALLDRLELPYDALPYLGSWKADTGLLKLVVDHVLAEKPQVVVEFGTGASTLVIARALQKAGGGQLISFDQHGDFVEATRDWLEEFGLEADLRAAPLKPSPDGWPGLWYDHGALPREIDMMLIDGPPWTVHPLVRGAAVSLFDRITPGGTVFLDDAARLGERVVARRWRKLRPDFDFRLDKSGSKGTLIGRRREL